MAFTQGERGNHWGATKSDDEVWLTAEQLLSGGHVEKGPWGPVVGAGKPVSGCHNKPDAGQHGPGWCW